MTYSIQLSKSARRALDETLPEVVAVACWEFIRGPLAENPQQVGKALRDEFEGSFAARRGEFRIVYTIDDNRIVVHVIRISHRRHAYRA